MPTPIPLLNLTAVQFELDFIQKMAPVEPAGSIGEPPVDFGEQRFESGLNLGENKGSKKRWTSLFTPFRMITTSPDGWMELQKNPDFYWSQVGWGIATTFMRNYVTGIGWFFGNGGDFDFTPFAGVWQDGRWLNGGPVLWHQYLTSAGLDGKAPTIGNPADGNVTVRVMQFLPAVDQDYQIWKVTTREPLFGPDFQVGGVFGAYTGTIPGIYPPITSEVPFANSSDYGLVSSGRLTAFEPFVIPPHDLAPRVNCQKPPAPNTQTDSDWAGWGVSNFLVLG